MLPEYDLRHLRRAGRAVHFVARPDDADDVAPVLAPGQMRNSVRQTNGRPSWDEISPEQRAPARLLPHHVLSTTAPVSANESTAAPVPAEVVPGEVREWFVRHTPPGEDWRAGVRAALRQHIARENARAAEGLARAAEGLARAAVG